MLTLTRLNKFAGVMLLFVPMAVMASQPTQRFAISPRQVVDALASAGLEVNVTQVEFLSEVSAVSDHASLQVVSTASRPAGNSMVKMRCHDNHECLPFYVLVHASKAIPRLQLTNEKIPLL